MTEELRRARHASLEPEHPADVSEVERLRRERDHWRHLFQRLVESFPEPAIVIDDEGTITHWNERQAEVLQVPAEAAVGETALSVIGTENTTETLADEIARTGEPIREEAIRSGTNEDGSPRHVRAEGVPLVSPDGEVVGAFEFTNIVTDLVEQRKSMESVQRQVSEEIGMSVTDLESVSARVTENVDGITEIADEEADRVTSANDEVQAFSATTEEVASSVETISAQSSETEMLAEASEDATRDLLKTVEEVSDSSERLIENAEDLSGQVDEIDQVIASINDLTEQINILALNASIEAARAGEAGQGFAVVADEVKSLAAASQTEADRIEEYIESVARFAEATVDSVERTTAKFSDIESQIGAVQENQQEIQESISDISGQLDQIATASDEQARSVADISTTLDGTVEAVERISDLVAKLAAANDRQTEQVAEIKASIEALERNLDSVVEAN